MTVEAQGTPRVASDPGLKHDGAKIPLDLLPFAALEEVGRVLEHGRIKYAAHNWRKGMQWSRLLGAALRHLFSWARGEERDPDSGLSHLAHGACCVLFLLEYVAGDERDRLASFDDRWKLAPQ